jgi:hypothetical protein
VFDVPIGGCPNECNVIEVTHPVVEESFSERNFLNNNQRLVAVMLMLIKITFYPVMMIMKRNMKSHHQQQMKNLVRYSVLGELVATSSNYGREVVLLR